MAFGLLVSSLEHEVLKVSYFDWSMSIVCHVSFVVCCAMSAICLKSLLLLHPEPIDSKLGRKHLGDL